MTYKLVDEYITQDAGRFNTLRNLPSSAEPLSRCEAPDDLAVVFHMGESVRADHLPLNGYHRNTMPRLSRESNVVSFPHATSFGIVTRISAIGMFTDAELRRRAPGHSSFIDLFNKHGFHTVRIMDLSGDSIHDYSLGILTRSCRGREQTPPQHQTPGMMQERTSLVMEKSLKRHGLDRQLYIIYNNGSHMAFSYPPQAERFTPASCNMDDPKAHLEETVNAYDNSIVDLDASIHRMIALLKNRPAIYFYCSDHGVALGEEGKMFQGHILPPVYRPAMFIWYSDAFASRYPDMVRALKANRLKAVSHDHIFHTLLSLASIRSEIVRNELNLASPDARETPVPLQPETLAEWLPVPAPPQPHPQKRGRHARNNRRRRLPPYPDLQ